MKVALVSPYDFAYPGGVVAHIDHLAREFQKDGHDVWILSPSSKPGRELGFDHFVHLGRPAPVPASGSIARLSLSPWLQPRIKSLLLKEQFDVVHLHEPLAPLLPLFVLGSSPSLNVGTFHSFQDHNRLYPLAARPFNHWFKRLHGRIGVSDAAVEFIKRYFEGEYTIIPNGIDVDHFSKTMQPIPKFKDGMTNILFVGRMEKRKGLRYLLKAFSRIKAQDNNVRLLVVGPGEPDKQSQRILGEHGLTDVEFIGSVSLEELPRFYQTADIFCAPATGMESFGIVLLEAMAAGVPIVASDIPGYASVLERGVQGLLVPPRDDKSLSDALLSLIRNRELGQKMVAVNRKRVEEYRWDKVASRVMSYYEDVRRQQSAKR